LGEFLPFGRWFSFGQFCEKYKRRPNFGGCLFSTVKFIYLVILTKMVWATF
jgi:hypothetical protein